jgi:hypothetical protein
MKHNGREEKCYRVLMGRPEPKRPLGRLNHRREIILQWIFWEWNGGCGLD